MIEDGERNNLALVRRLCSHWHEFTREEFAGVLSADCLYINMPWPARKWRGPEAAIDHLTFLQKTYITEVETVSEIVEGDMVMSERVERFRRRIDGQLILELPVTGVFSVRNGRISEWRDYFDSQQAKILRAQAIDDGNTTGQ